MDQQQTVWLYYELAAAGQVGMTPHGTFEIQDHLVEVPAGQMANALLQQEYRTSDFNGRYIIPAHAYRLASEAEVAAVLTNYPERVTAQRAADVARLADEEAALAAQLAALAARRQEADAALAAATAAMPDVPGETTPAGDATQPADTSKAKK